MMPLSLLPMVTIVPNAEGGLLLSQAQDIISLFNPHNHHEAGSISDGELIYQMRTSRHRSDRGLSTSEDTKQNPQFTIPAEIPAKIPAKAFLPWYHLTLLFKAHFLILVQSGASGDCRTEN